jgi:hypothetical protein
MLAGVSLLALCGCAATRASSNPRPGTAGVPSYVTEPFSHQEQLVEQGAQLVVSDGCAACHLSPPGKAIAPSFASFAGHRVKLTDGRTVLVDERFLREGLREPRKSSLRGYAAAPMLASLQRLHLASHPQQVAALVAFIEQVGPEAE